MKLIIYLLLLLVFPFSLMSQNEYCDCGYPDAVEYTTKLSGRSFISQHISHKEQFYSEWSEGIITLYNNTNVENMLIRYNGLIDELLWLRTKDYKSIIIDKIKVKSFIIFHENGVTSEFHKTMITNGMNNSNTGIFLQTLVKGKISLHVFRKVIELKNTGELVKRPQYYVYKGSEYVRFKPNRISIIRLFATKEEKSILRKTIRKHHLKLRKEDDIITFIRLVNKL